MRRPSSPSFQPKFPSASTLAGCALLAGLSTACGDEDSEPHAWEGKTYLLEVPEGNWADPPRIGQDIADFVPGFLFTVNSATDSAVDVTMATADPNGIQDACNPTATLAGAPAPYPSVELVFPEFLLHIPHVSEPVQVIGTVWDLTLKNVLPDGGSPARDGELVATMDMRELYPLFRLLINPTPDTVCSALADLPAPCEPCPTDGEAYCLTVTAIGLGATEYSGGPPSLIDESEIAPSCVQIPEP